MGTGKAHECEHDKKGGCEPDKKGGPNTGLNEQQVIDWIKRQQIIAKKFPKRTVAVVLWHGNDGDQEGSYKPNKKGGRSHRPKGTASCRLD